MRSALSFGASPFCAGRARDLIVAACTATAPNVVLLPGLYCGEVTDAIAAAGLSWRCYDLDSTLSPPLNLDEVAGSSDLVCLIWCHHFGLVNPVPALPGHIHVIEDGCHALRSYAVRGLPWPTDRIAVFSPRKELGWPDGGIAAWPGQRPAWPPEIGDISARWRDLPLDAEIQYGQIDTRAARSRLSAYLPSGHDDDVLTYLPLLSRHADKTITELRRRGLDAWRWLDAPCLRRPQEAPIARAIWEKLVLVRWGAIAAQQIEVLAAQAWLPWPHN